MNVNVVGVVKIPIIDLIETGKNIKRIREKKEPKITLPWEKKKKEKGSSGTENDGDAPSGGSGDKKGRKRR